MDNNVYDKEFRAVIKAAEATRKHSEWLYLNDGAPWEGVSVFLKEVEPWLASASGYILKRCNQCAPDGHIIRPIETAILAAVEMVEKLPKEEKQEKMLSFLKEARKLASELEEN